MRRRLEDNDRGPGDDVVSDHGVALTTSWLIIAPRRHGEHATRSFFGWMHREPDGDNLYLLQTGIAIEALLEHEDSYIDGVKDRGLLHRTIEAVASASYGVSHGIDCACGYRQHRDDARFKEPDCDVPNRAVPGTVLAPRRNRTGAGMAENRPFARDPREDRARLYPARPAPFARKKSG